MPARRPIRPTPVAALTVPAVTSEEIKRAILPIVEAIRDLQRRVGLLDRDANAATDGSAPFFDTIITPAQINFSTSLATWNVGTLGETTLIRYNVDSGSRNVPGLAGGSDGKVVCMMNTESATSETAFFLHLSGVPPVGDRFHNAGAGNVNGNTLGCVWYYYDGPRSLWQHIGGTQ